MKVQCDNCGKEFSDTINMGKIPNGIILPMKNKQTMNLCADCFFHLGKSSEREKVELVKKLSKKFNRRQKMELTLIKKDTGEVVFSMNTEDNNDIIVHKDYALIDSPHDFTNIDGKLYVNTKYRIDEV